MAVSLVFASIWRAIWGAQKVSFELGKTLLLYRASEAWTLC